MTWQPMSTAPKDGTIIIIAYVGESESEAGYFMDDKSRNHWEQTGWFGVTDDVLCGHPRQEPDCWMSLPEPPKEPVE